MENKSETRTTEDNKSAFVAVATTSLDGKGSPISLRAKLSLADYQAMLQKEEDQPQSQAKDESTKPVVTKKTNAAGEEVQTITVNQARIPALVNPQRANKHDSHMAAQVVDTSDGPELKIPVRKVRFVINGKSSSASKLKQFLPNGESNLFKIVGDTINVVPAKDFSGEIMPIKLAVTTVNGDSHEVDYVTRILKPVVTYADDSHDRAQVSLKGSNQQIALKDAGVQQVFFTKDGNNTTVINVTANGQTVAEAQVDPTSGEIKLVRLSDYAGQLDKVILSLYLADNQVVTCQYQP
jgi:hypothetical protein